MAIVKYPAESVSCSFVVTNLGVNAVKIRAKPKLDGFIEQSWNNLGEVSGGQTRTFMLSRKLSDYTRSQYASAELWVAAALATERYEDAKEVYHNKWVSLYQLDQRAASIKVSTVIWGSPMPDIAKVLAQSYL